MDIRKFESRSRDLGRERTRPNFPIFWILRFVINLCTKLEVCTFSRFIHSVGGTKTIRLCIHYGVYLDSFCHFVDDIVGTGPLRRRVDLRKFSPVSHTVSLLTYLSLNNSTICRAIAVIFSCVILRDIPYLTASIFYPYGAPVSYRVAPKTVTYMKFTIFDIPLYKICGGWESQVNKICSGVHWSNKWTQCD